MPPKSKKPKVDFTKLVNTFKERDDQHTTYSSAWSKAYSSDFVQSRILNINEKFGLVVSKFGLQPVIQVLSVIGNSDPREVSPKFVGETLGLSVTLCELVLKLQLQSSSSKPEVATATATSTSSSTTTILSPVTASAACASAGSSSSSTTSATTISTANVLNHVSTDITLFTPPSLKCLKCFSKLIKEHQPVKVRYFTLKGLKHCQKLNLRCRSCDITYKYDMFGSIQTFWTYYDEPRIAVKANDCVFVERQLFELQCNLA